MASRKKTALVSGGSRGIGRATCEALARLDYRVLLGARTLEVGQRVADELAREGLDVEAVPLDVCAADSIVALCDRISQQGVSIDALVNNAGVALDGFDADVVHRTMAVNVHGVIALSDSVMFSLADRARIVMVSSGLGELAGVSDACRRRFEDPLPDRKQLRALLTEFESAVREGRHEEEGWPSSAYRVSKVALNAFTRKLAQENPPLRINAVCPGWVATDMGGSSAPRTPAQGAKGVVWAATLGAEGPNGGFFRDGEPIPW